MGCFVIQTVELGWVAEGGGLEVGGEGASFDMSKAKERGLGANTRHGKFRRSNCT